VNRWLLQVELNGEWEECSYPTQKQALAAFVALARDYTQKLRRAVLLKPQSTERDDTRPSSKYLN
jgi:hypothetical protein